MKRIGIVAMLAILLVSLLITSVACSSGYTEDQLKQAKEKAVADAKLNWDKDTQTKIDQVVKAANDACSAKTATGLKDTTYAEAVNMMEEDKTDQEIKGNHSLAVMMVVNNMLKRGINCYYIIARTKEGSSIYSFVGFNTTDKGWVYFCAADTCADQEAKLKIGERLYKLNPQWGVMVPWNDTIIDIYRLPSRP